MMEPLRLSGMTSWSLDTFCDVEEVPSESGWAEYRIVGRRWKLVAEGGQKEADDLGSILLIADGIIDRFHLSRMMPVERG